MIVLSLGYGDKEMAKRKGKRDEGIGKDGKRGKGLLALQNLISGVICNFR